jgi:hypothetical protein
VTLLCPGHRFRPTVLNIVSAGDSNLYLISINRNLGEPSIGGGQPTPPQRRQIMDRTSTGRSQRNRFP